MHRCGAQPYRRQAAFQASQPQFRQLHPAALWGQEFLGGEEDLPSMVRAGLRWLRFKVMKISFGHVHLSNLNSLSYVPRDGQKVSSSPCAVVADRL